MGVEVWVMRVEASGLRVKHNEEEGIEGPGEEADHLSTPFTFTSHKVFSKPFCTSYPQIRQLTLYYH